MNVLNTEMAIPEILEAMHEDPELFYEEDNGAYHMYGIEPALRFVLSYWADPRPVSPRHIMNLVYELVKYDLDPTDDEGARVLRIQAKEWEAFFADAHRRSIKFYL